MTEKNGPVHTDGHTTPERNWKTMIPARITDQLAANVLHKGGMSADEYIGTAVVPVALLATGDVMDAWFPLSKNGVSTGEINLRMQLMLPGESALTLARRRRRSRPPPPPPPGAAPAARALPPPARAG